MISATTSARSTWSVVSKAFGQLVELRLGRGADRLRPASGEGRVVERARRRLVEEAGEDADPHGTISTHDDDEDHPQERRAAHRLVAQSGPASAMPVDRSRAVDATGPLVGASASATLARAGPHQVSADGSELTCRTRGTNVTG